MCVVSAVGDSYREWFPERWPDINPMKPIQPAVDPNGIRGWKKLNNQTSEVQYVTLEQFEKLRAEFVKLKELLKAAKKFDEATGQPECEMDDKVALIKKLAESLGVDMSSVFK